jgi:hypothetical protein
MQLSAGFISLSIALAGATVSAAPIKTDSVLLKTLSLLPGADVLVNPTIGAAYCELHLPDSFNELC